MIPVVLVAQSKKVAEEYIRKFIAERGYVPSQIFKIAPINNSLGVEDVREVRRMIVVSSSQTRLFIFDSFELSSFEAQNALLKTLEEKTADNQFLFLCQNEEQIVPTIRSRSKVIRLEPGRPAVFFDHKIDKSLNEIVNSSINLNFLTNEYLDGLKNTEALSLIDGILMYFRRRAAAGDNNSSAIIKKSFELRYLLASNNLSPRLAIDNLLIYIYRKYRMK